MEGQFTEHDVVFQGRNHALLSDEFQKKILVDTEAVEVPRQQLRRLLTAKNSPAGGGAATTTGGPSTAPVPLGASGAAAAGIASSASSATSVNVSDTSTAPSSRAPSVSDFASQVAAGAAQARPPTVTSSTMVPAQPFSSATQLAAFLNPPVTPVRGKSPAATPALASSSSAPAGLLPPAPSAKLPATPLSPPPAATPTAAPTAAPAAKPASEREPKVSSKKTGGDAAKGDKARPASAVVPSTSTEAIASKGAPRPASTATPTPASAAGAPTPVLTRQQQIAEIRRKKKASAEQYKKLTERLSKVCCGSEREKKRQGTALTAG